MRNRGRKLLTDWLREHQKEDGLWDTTYVAGKQVGSARERDEAIGEPGDLPRVLPLRGPARAGAV